MKKVTDEYYHEIAGFDIYVIIGLHCSIGWDESKFREEIGDMK